MQSQAPQSGKRRNHGAEFKAKVIAACREPGASVAAVAQAHGVNANLVRQWLVGRGVKRCGLQQASGEIASSVATRAELPSAAMPFVPVQLPAPTPAVAAAAATAEPERSVQLGDQAIQIELTRCGAKLTVRWPAAQASDCAGWLGELAAALAQ